MPTAKEEINNPCQTVRAMWYLQLVSFLAAGALLSGLVLRPQGALHIPPLRYASKENKAATQTLSGWPMSRFLDLGFSLHLSPNRSTHSKFVREPLCDELSALFVYDLSTRDRAVCG